MYAFAKKLFIIEGALYAVYWVLGTAQTWNYFSLLGKIFLSLSQLGCVLLMLWVAYKFVIRFMKDKVKS